MAERGTPLDRGGDEWDSVARAEQVVLFPEPVVARVRIEYGNGELGPDESADYDVAVMDDFLYAEPQAEE